MEQDFAPFRGEELAGPSVQADDEILAFVHKELESTYHQVVRANGNMIWL